ncbi:hypothetical protein RHSIM_Rhsim03G0070400 [Rhododendron simsii]|uniref:Cholesterol oxidase n=1 Tax=Rhododendron simsii TaxID=118357 RepID=A0A834LTG9_RHOSS|nr:hypothetical protein RHSIM_Rhsim03G0070400 [Rhododendron simsii]
MEKVDQSEEGYDAIVVGSGYGGSVAACRLSMAGIKVCLVEKGRRWESKDFPTDSLKILSAVRIENQIWGLALVYEQDDSLAAVACGLGGGSLINAGVMLPTPLRARRNPNWPKEWERDWESCEASASAMLRVQSVPTKFPNAKVMEQTVGEEFEETGHGSVKLSVTFDIEDKPNRSPENQGMGSCLACGNCLAGCPYNAKNSTGKTYLASAVQPQLRGLKLSERLGSGFSCNGNAVAYVAGSPAPLNAYGLAKTDLLSCMTWQSAVLPTAYPYLLFKGIATYGWPYGCWFLHGVIDKLKHILGHKACNAMILNAMGYDQSDGKITFDKNTNKICFIPPHDLLLSRKIEAFQKLTKKVGGILFVSRCRSTSVHHLGGCNASSDPSSGVCNPNGQVFDRRSHTSSVLPGLYVCDASLLPCSVDVNPCLTIATLSEHISRHLVQDILKYKSIDGSSFGENFGDQKPGSMTSVDFGRSLNPTVVFKETMIGYVGGMPCSANLTLQMNSNSRTQTEVDQKSSSLGLSYPLLRGKVGGYVIFRAVEVDELHIIDGEVDLCEVDERTPYAQYMRYCLLLAASSGSRYILEGKKVMNPYIFGSYVWRETTTMHVTFNKVVVNNSKEEGVKLKGKLSISMIELLKCLTSIKGNARGNFLYLLLLTFFRTYISQVPRGSHKELHPSKFHRRPYPNSTLHEIQTEDGFTIKSNDLVRTLLEEGHETWLLQPRLHPLNPSNNFTVEHIARFDIPAAINTIRYLHGPMVKIHVVAHCVGGLAIHMALMGGHVSPALLASLCCTNSSMFFKLNASSRFKMWLPLIPISMVILGKNKVLPLLKTSNAPSRQRLLKSITHLVPRYKRCTCDKCEVFSGIFGNTFWHDNVTPSLHYWLNKQNLLHLPMGAFPHLRKICNTGYTVDPNGQNSYLIHPERMALPTLYLSGGRTLLVTPHTSFLANNCMKMHQPGFRHERVVVEGFGHSDLLIGEESHVKVSPHILTHIRLAEEEEKSVTGGERRKYNQEALAWGDDPFVDGNGGIWIYCSAAVSCIVFAAVVSHFFAVGFSKWYAIVLSMIVKRPPLKSCLLWFVASDILPGSLCVAVISATTWQILWCGIIYLFLLRRWPFCNAGPVFA